MSQRPLGPGRLALNGMFSLEPAAFPTGGLPQLLQTGETYLNQLILDRQHPHNLVMELAALYRIPLNSDWSAFVYGGPVGEPALGPKAFMHRASAADNPWAPLVHHLTDSTHITDGVVSGGVVFRSLKLDASLFNAGEPGENRWAVTQGPLDSYSGRLTFNLSPDLSMQISTGHLITPEALSPFDTQRTTASVTYDRSWDDGNWAATLPWGCNRELTATPRTGTVILQRRRWIGTP